MGSRRSAHRAFTMFELLVVLAIMAVVAALAIPRLRSAVGRSHLQLAAQQLAEDLTAARLFAIEMGVTYDVRRDAAGQRYVVRPQRMNSLALGTSLNQHHGSYESATSTANSNAGDARTTPASRSGGTSATVNNVLPRRPATIDTELGHGIQFHQPTMLAGVSGTTIDTKSQLGRRLVTSEPSTNPSDVSMSLTSDPGSSESWTRVARFFPDGRAATSRITLYSDDGYRIDLTIRRLTGGVQVGFIERQPAIDKGSNLEQSTPLPNEQSRVRPSIEPPNGSQDAGTIRNPPHPHPILASQTKSVIGTGVRSARAS